MGEGLKDSALQKINTVVTILIAVLGGVLSVRQCEMDKAQTDILVAQQELSSKLKLYESTNIFVETVEKYLEKVEHTPQSKKEILGALLNIVSKSNMSIAGDSPDAGVNLLRIMPLHFSLLTQNPDTLAHIAPSGPDRDIWVELAEKSANLQAKETAIRALEYIGKYGKRLEDEKVAGENQTGISHDFPDLPYAIEKIISISNQGQIPELNKAVTHSLYNLLSLVESPNDPDPRVISIIQGGFNLAQDLSAESQETAPSSPDGMPEPGKRIVVPEVAPKQAGPEVDVAQVGKGEHLADKQRSLEAVQALKDRLDLPNQPAEVDDTEITELIKKLDSASKEERRLARRRLGELGAKAVESLLDVLKGPKVKYNVRLGVVSSLFFMEQPIAIPKEKIESVVKLSGDRDTQIRRNAASFLLKETDKETIRAATPLLLYRLQDTNNSPGLYNAVVILGEWNTMKAGKKLGITLALQQAKKRLTREGAHWEKTIKKIDESLRRVGAR